jgi:CheY-like chemotaxis protein
MSKIFFVDDDSMMRDVFEKTFRLYGHEILFARDGKQFLTDILALEQKPDLILLDMMMPTTNGFEVLEEIKKNETIKDIPVICFSNLAESADAEKAKKLGAADYIIKSEYPPKQVVDKIEEVIKNSKK